MIAATGEILSDNGIRGKGSPDVMAIWNAKPASRQATDSLGTVGLGRRASIDAKEKVAQARHQPALRPEGPKLFGVLSQIMKQVPSAFCAA
jgi:hypothetical protein